MKFHGLLWAVFLLAAGSMCAQVSGGIQVHNFSIVNNELHCDLYLKSTGSSPIYLSDCNYALNFNKVKWSNPQVVFTPAAGRLTDFYQYQTSIQQDSTIYIDVFAPNVQSQGIFNTRVQEIASTGTGTLLGSLKISGISDFSGLADIHYRTAPFFYTLVHTFAPGPPFTSTQVTLSYPASGDVALGPYFECSLKNQQLQSNEYTFDVYLRRTGGIPLHLSDCTLNITFDASRFNSPAASIVSRGTSRLQNNYTFGAQIVNGNVFRLTIGGPATANEGEFNSKLEVVSDELPSGTKIATLKISGAKPGISILDIAPAWGTAGNTGVVKRRRAFAPWSANDDISANGSYLIGTPALALSLSAPNTAGSFCTGTTQNISWEHINVSQIKIEIVPQQGAPRVLAAAVNASAGSWSWLADEAAGNYKIRISDVANAQITDISDQFFTVQVPPQVTQSPSDKTSCPGGSVTFSAAGTGDPAPQIQWQISSTGGAVWSDIGGANQSTLLLTNINAGINTFLYRAVFSNNCGSTPTEAAQLRVHQAPAIGQQPQNATLCRGATLNLAISASGQPTPQIQWQVHNGSAWSDMNGQTMPTLSIANFPVEHNGYRYRARVWNACGELFSQEASVTVHTPPTVEQQPVDVSVCEGEPYAFEASAQGNPTPTIQWQYSTDGGFAWINIPGQNGMRLQIAAAERSANQYRYRAVFGNACSSAVAGARAVVTVNYAPEIVLQPEAVQICEGGDVVFQSLAQARPQAAVRWQVRTPGGDWSDLSGATQNVLTLTDVSAGLNGNEYRAVYSNSCGADVASEAAQLTVNSAPGVSLHPSPVEICRGGSAGFAAAAGGRPAPGVRWEVSFNGGADWFPVAGANGTSLNLDNVRSEQDGNLYRAVFSNVCAADVATTPAELRVLREPRITVHPVSARIIVGENVTFTVAADVNNIGYEWYREGRLLLNGSRISGANTANLTISNAGSADISSEYYVRVIGECGSDTSDFFALNVDVPDIEILTQPVETGLCRGGNARFSVSAKTDVNGASLRYQWRRGAVELQEGAKYQGVNTPELTITNVEQSDAGSKYNVQIVVTPGGETTYSDNVNLVVGLEPQIQQHAESIAVCAGSPAVLEIAATGSAPLRYQWKYRGEDISGANQARFIIPEVQAGDTGAYTCTVSNECGKLESFAADVSLKAPTVITVQPTADSAFSDRPHTLSVVAEGEGTLTYQWYLNGAPISGATRRSYTIAEPGSADAGVYTVRVRGACGDVLSREARIDIVVVGISATPEPELFRLEQNYPNPFSLETHIPFTLEQAALVELRIADSFGREIQRIRRYLDAPGRHAFAFRADHTLSAGVYYYTLFVNGMSYSRAMLLLR